jgi:hypothetical protein
MFFCDIELVHRDVQQPLEYVIARSEATWRSLCHTRLSFGIEIATLLSVARNNGFRNKPFERRDSACALSSHAVR